MFTNNQVHYRHNILNGERVLVSPSRSVRPWQGKLEKPQAALYNAYEPTCYLCPGNTRANGQVNPHYPQVYTFNNDFPAINLHTKPESLNQHNLLIAQTIKGICRVICFSPEHNVTLALMDAAARHSIVAEWTKQYLELAAMPEIQYVQIFENRGEMMGSSMPHPHGQIWAQSTIPDLVLVEDAKQREWYLKNQSVMLMEYLNLELKQGERLVCHNQSWVALVPFWAVWPFETIVIPRNHRCDLSELSQLEQDQLGDIIGQLCQAYDRLFNVSFPYTMGIHQAPCNGQESSHWQMHLHFFPPLLRSATVRKFMVGYELLAQAQRDITPEAAAERLRACLRVN